MKTILAIAAVGSIAFSATAFAGAHAQVNLNASDNAANNGTVMGAYLRDTPEGGLAPSAASTLKGGWGNVGSNLANEGGRVSNENGAKGKGSKSK